ncbi:MAG: response regulator [Flavobacteriales bacterium]|jgi:signal transduction histidine kinase/DNA-binding response OmpR family regulator|nr:response regulator [Flavobacteriales bacterium]
MNVKKTFFLLLALLLSPLSYGQKKQNSIRHQLSFCKQNIYKYPDTVSVVLKNLSEYSLSDKEKMELYFYQYWYDHIYQKYTTASRASAVKGLGIANKQQHHYYQIQFNAAMIRSYINEQERAPQYYSNLQNLLKKIKEPSLRFDIYNALGMYHYIVTADTEKIAEYIAEADKIFEVNETSLSLFQLKDYYWIKGVSSTDLDKGLYFLDRALEVTMSIGDNYLKYDLYLWKIIYLTGIKGISDPELIIYIESLLQEPEKDKRHKRIYYPYLLQSLVFSGQDKKAENVFQLFEKRYKASGYKVNNEVNINMLGYFVYKKKQPHQSITYLEKYMNDIINHEWSKQDSLAVKMDRELKAKDLELKILAESFEAQKNAKQRDLIIGVSLIIFTLLAIYVYIKLKFKNQKLSLLTKYYDREKTINEERSLFLENISHEIKTPVTMVSGVLELINETKDKEKKKELLELARVNIKKLKREIKGMTYMNNHALIRKDNSERVPILFFMKKILTENLIGFRSKSVCLKWKHNFDLNTWVQLDDEKIQIIINNLISNALKYSPEKSLVEIECWVNEGEFYFQITDSGQGIPANEVNKVFDRFFQASNSKVGQGIGLAIVKHISDAISGKVNVTSEPNISTCFSFRFPTKFGEELSEKSSYTFYETQKLIQQITFKENKSTLLIVDDNEFIHAFYQEIFFDYNCVFSFGALAALDFLEKNKVDCVISDVMMPNMDGFDLKEAMNKNKLTIPVVFVTAKSIVNNKIEALRIGVIDYIQKPFEINELRVRVRNIIENYHSKLQYIDQEIIPTQNNVLSEKQHIELKAQDPMNIVKRMIKDIEKNISSEEYGVKQLAESVFYSESQLRRIVKKLTGFTPNKLILEVKLLRAESLLRQYPHAKIYEIQQQIGIKSSPYFSKVFKERFGIFPSEILERNNHVDIQKNDIKVNIEID